ncbi:MAG: DUF4349 domain-containing protein [Solobacterium sp.]|nr:DUF4349 domain-containing protein [Solobacterium sp.]
MNKTMNKTMKFVSAALLAVTLAACGSAHSSSSADYAPESYSGSGYGLAGSSYNNSYMADAAAAPAMEEAEMADYDAKAEDGSEPGTDETVQITGDMLVYTGSLNLETLNYEDTVAAVRDRIRSYQGIIEQEDEWDSDRSWTYTDGRKRTMNRSISMTLRIPTTSFDSFMNDMDGAGKVTARSQSVENISRRYNDNSIEIESLRKQQERLLEMMDAADTVEEMIMVESRLTEVQTQLNQKLSYKANMDTDVKYSTIYLNINEVQEYTPVDNSVQIGGFWKKLWETVKSSWIYFVYFLENLVFALVSILPYVLLIGLILFGVMRYRKAKGITTKLFQRKKKEPRDWKAYADEKKAQLDAKKEAEAIEKELNEAESQEPKDKQ